MNEFLRILAKVVRSKKQRNALIKKATQKQLNSVRNICYNVCCKRFKLSDKTRGCLKHYAKHIRDLANRKKLKSVRGLKGRLIQHGGFLPILLPAILGFLSSIGSKLVGKAIGV